MNTANKSLIALFFAAVLAIPFGFAAGEPENVSGLTANTMGANSIGLSWNSAKDGNGGLVDHYKIYYGSISVQTAGEGDYEKEINTINNSTSYVVGELKADTTYYFSVTAIDANDLESEAYSLEASATTTTSEGDVKEVADPVEVDDVSAETADSVPPTVITVNSVDNTHIAVVFSEAILLPKTTPQAAFTITEQLVTATVLEVVSAVKESSDTSGATVLLETATQTKGTGYILTAGVAITDVAENPIVSGNTDSGVFTGVAETTIPIVKDCGTDINCVYTALKTCAAANAVVTENEMVTKYTVAGEEGVNCKWNYEVSAVATPEDKKNLTCLLPSNDLSARVLATMTQNKPLLLNKEEGSALCSGTYLDEFLKTLPDPELTTPAADTTPPENVRSLALSFKEQLDKFVVMLSWSPSLNKAKDLVDQMLYMSHDRGKNYDAGKALGKDSTQHEVSNLEAGREYTFKITTKDAAGNESTGVVKSIRLPQTGAGIVLLLLGSALGAQRMLQRRKN
jgi:hypothetical protein